MFTGIVEARGVAVSASMPKLRIKSPFSDLHVGDSIAVNGVCLTVTDSMNGEFAADLSEETLMKTNLGSISEGTLVNLERPMAAGSSFGGHIVQGHVDGLCEVVDLKRLRGSTELVFKPVEQQLLRYLVVKGSVCLDGVSLTVTEVGPADFGVSLIPHTLEATNLGDKKIGSQVNIEVDILAKYVERLLETKS